MARTQESVILDDASARGQFEGDAYIRERHARSVLCLPLVKQGRLVALIYLENGLTPNAFTPARTAVLKVLASQAAMSLENTWLYKDLEGPEAKIRRLVDANIIGIFLWDRDRRILEANDAFLRMIKYDRQDLTAFRLRCSDLTPPEWRERTDEMFREHKMHRRAGPFENEYLCKDGSRVPVLVAAAAIEATNGESVSFVLDLTERKRAEQAVRDGERRSHELQLRLAEANRIASIGELSASIAHEINQPLSGIITNASTCLRLLAADPPNIELASETARRTIRDGNLASGVITRLRALFARSEAVAQPVDLNEVTREVLALAANELRRERVMLRSELVDGPCVVNGDQVQLQQVVLNLLRNAVDAMRNVHGRPRELDIRTERENGDRVRLTVKDTGLGLESQDLERVFEAFYTTKKTGMGIGLSVSRSIIESHHGRLWAVQNDGPGATFAFSIPRNPHDAIANR